MELDEEMRVSGTMTALGAMGGGGGARPAGRRGPDLGPALLPLALLGRTAVTL